MDWTKTSELTMWWFDLPHSGFKMDEGCFATSNVTEPWADTIGLSGTLTL